MLLLLPHLPSVHVIKDINLMSREHVIVTVAFQLAGNSVLAFCVIHGSNNRIKFRRLQDSVNLFSSFCNLLRFDGRYREPRMSSADQRNETAVLFLLSLHYNPDRCRHRKTNFVNTKMEG